MTTFCFGSRASSREVHCPRIALLYCAGLDCDMVNGFRASEHERWSHLGYSKELETKEGNVFFFVRGALGFILWATS